MDAPRVDLTEAELTEGLSACLAVPRWVDEVAAGAPFPSLDALLEAAREAAPPSSPAEIDQAMAHHPRIGERVTGQSPAHRFASAEQQASRPDDEHPADERLAELAQGNAAYEKRFGRVFLIRAAGRSGPEILEELRRRLELDPETETAIVGAELRDIALLRIPQLFAHLDAHSEFDESDAAR